MRLSSKNYEQLLNKLKALGQQHLLEGTPTEELLLEIETLDSNQFRKLQSLIHEPPPKYTRLAPSEPFIPVESLPTTLNDNCTVGCLIVAGGQGTRLGFKGPKGMFKLGSKTLYQILAERTRLSNQKACRFLPIAIMTSPENREETEGYFRINDFFGLIPEQVEFFTQTEIPFLDDQGNLFLNSMGDIAQGPDGNGWALKNFYTSGIWEKWYKQGIRTLNFTLIDNLLADPFDPQLTNFHVEHNNDITVKAILREDPMEKVGIFAKLENRLNVIEYSEFPLEERLARLENGGLAYPYANISLFCFRMASIPEWNFEAMPWHLAHKPAQRKDLTSPLAWKFEKFIFDVLPLATKIGGLLYPRKSCFAPLKSKEDLPVVQAALQSLNLDDKIK